MRFPTMWYMQSAKAQISLRIRESDQSLCKSLEYSMSVELLIEHYFEFLSLKEAAQARLSLHLSKCHIVRNHLSLWCLSVVNFSGTASSAVDEWESTRGEKTVTFHKGVRGTAPNTPIPHRPRIPRIDTN